MPSRSKTDLEFDVVVVGAGTAGLAAAKSAHAEGARVALVDHGPLGSLCARRGCMPSKILLQSADALARARRLNGLGVSLQGDPTLDWLAVRKRERALVEEFVASVVRTTTMSKSFTLLRGAASFVDEDTLSVDGRVEGGDGKELLLSARGWVVATGSVTVIPKVPGLDDVEFLTSDDVFDLDAIPKSIAVIGAGAIAVELGQFLARAGAEVHLIGQDARLAALREGPLHDALSVPLSRELRLHLRTKIVGVRRDKTAARLSLESVGKHEEIRVEKILVAAGRRPNLQGLGLDRIGVRIDDGLPAHDEFLRSGHSALFVAGDVAGPPALLHVASRQGAVAGRNAAHPEKQERAPHDPNLTVVFCDPIVASVGLDPETAKRDGFDVCVASRRWAEQGKARIMDETEGVAELTVDRKTRKILGCQIVGVEADVLIHLPAYALHFGATVDDLLALPHYHPTLAEMFPSLAEGILAQIDGGRFVCGVAPSAELQ